LHGSVRLRPDRRGGGGGRLPRRGRGSPHAPRRRPRREDHRQSLLAVERRPRRRRVLLAPDRHGRTARRHARPGRAVAGRPLARRRRRRRGRTRWGGMTERKEEVEALADRLQGSAAGRAIAADAAAPRGKRMSAAALIEKALLLLGPEERA